MREGRQVSTMRTVFYCGFTCLFLGFSLLSCGKGGVIYNQSSYIVRGPNGAVLEVPKGSVPDGVEIVISLADVQPEPGAFIPVGRAYQVGPTGTQFGEPPTLVLPYDASMVPSGYAEQQLVVFTRQASGTNWERLSSLVDVNSKTVRARLLHLSYYQLGVEIPEQFLAPILDCLDDLEAKIQALPDDAFRNNSEQRKRSFSNKLRAMRHQLENDAAYVEFLQKLQNDIFAKMDGHLGGHPSNDWVVSQSAQVSLKASIDCILEGDVDNDGLTFVDEIQTYGTNPFNPDTDGDGLNDGEEVAYWNSRTDGIGWDHDLEVVAKTSGPPLGDGLINLLDPDSDGDGLLDGTEVWGWTIHVVPIGDVQTDSDPAFADTDTDGLSDRLEHDGWTIDVAGNILHVVSNPRFSDTDGDGLTDWRERLSGTDPGNPRTYSSYYHDQSRDALRAAFGGDKLRCPVLNDFVPEEVYITQFMERISMTGSWAYEIMFFQPDDTGEPIRLNLSSLDLNSVPEFNNEFTDVLLVRYPGDPDHQVSSPLPGFFGTNVYQIPSSAKGWYMLQFVIHANVADKYLHFWVKDAGGHHLPVHWIDSPGPAFETAMMVYSPVDTRWFFKGGTYSSFAHGNEYSYLRDVRLDYRLLYEKAFDRGMFSFPLGLVRAGDHFLSVKWEHDGQYPVKYWLHVCSHSFDPDDRFKIWDRVQITYSGDAHTKDYLDHWSEGVAIKQAVVRRGSSFYVVGKHWTYETGDGDARVFPEGSNVEVNWPKTLVEDYAGGRFLLSGFARQFREHWHIEVPESAAVGKYEVRMYDANGFEIGDPAGLYVIFNPYLTSLSKEERETYAYDEDEDGGGFEGHGPDDDKEVDGYSAYFYPGDNQSGYTLNSFQKRNPDNTSVLDLAIAAVNGSTDKFEAARRLYRLVNQRIYWVGRPPEPRSRSVEDILNHDLGRTDPLTVADAELYSTNDQNMPEEKRVYGQCMDFANVLVGLLRAVGIPSRTATADSVPIYNDTIVYEGLFGFNYHVFTEVHLEGLVPLQSGTIVPGGVFPSDWDSWYLFDSTDTAGDDIHHAEESIDPRIDYLRSSVVLTGYGPPHIVVPALTWDPDHSGPGGAIRHVLSEYQRNIEFWIEPPAEFFGWLGWGDKDFFRVSLPADTTLSITVDPPDLEAEIFYSRTGYPDMSAPSGTSFLLGAGTWYIMVAATSSDALSVHGNTVKYNITFQ